KDFELELHIDKSVKPSQANPRKIPFHLRKAVEDQLKIKLDNDIIEEVENDPTTWLSETVKISKKDSEEIRLCIDTTAVNKAILGEKHEMPSADDIIYAANGMKYFSKADLKSGFEQIKLHKNSRYISRFRTHKGIYQYKRLFFGIHSAPEIFHKEIRKILEGIPFQINASDDILMMGKDREEHNATVIKNIPKFSEVYMCFETTPISEISQNDNSLTEATSHSAEENIAINESQNINSDRTNINTDQSLNNVNLLTNQLLQIVEQSNINGEGSIEITSDGQINQIDPNQIELIDPNNISVQATITVYTDNGDTNIEQRRSARIADKSKPQYNFTRNYKKKD
ncbi:unnamed protein product, partial [Brachionus calyciflorus]